MIVKFNYKQEHFLQVPFMLEKAFRSLPNVDVYGPSENFDGVADLVVNSMPWNNLIKGKKTVYWELDMVESIHPEAYGDCDIVYFPSNYRKEIWPSYGKFLPMAVDFDFYHPFPEEINYDVMFLGRLDRTLRSEYIEKLKSDFNLYSGGEERGLSTSKKLSQARCSFQVSEFKNLEQRNFEYSAVVPMILERVPDLEVFTEKEHYLGFDRDDFEELKKQVKWCVDNYDKAIEMRNRMVSHLKNNHTYIHRAKQILEDIS